MSPNGVNSVQWFNPEDDWKYIVFDIVHCPRATPVSRLHNLSYDFLGLFTYLPTHGRSAHLVALVHVNYRREPLNEAHDSTFGILGNYHCWRDRGSGVIVALQIIGLFFLYWHAPWVFLRSSMRFRFPHVCSKIPKICNWSMDNGVLSVCFRGDFAIKTVVGFLR